MAYRNRRATLLGSALTLACSLSAASRAAAPRGDLILRDPSPPAASPAARQTTAAAPELVQVDASVLAAAPDALWLELVAGEGRWAYLTDLERGAAGDLVWRGRFADDEPGYRSVTLSLHDGVLVGTLQLPHGPTYLLRPSREGGWELRVRDPGALSCGVGGADEPLDAAERPSETAPLRFAAADRVAAAATADREVYVLVLYTPSAAARVGAARIQSTARHGVDYFNTALLNSGIDGRAFLAAAVQADLGFHDMNPGEALRHAFEHPLARQLQDRWRADVVSLVVDSSNEVPSVCGFANVMFRSLRGPQMANQAYNIIGEGCFIEDVFTHEVGHNFGAQHDPASASTPQQAAYPFSFAHGVDGHFRTLMSYNTACEECTNLDNVFSNPLRSIDGVPTGVTDHRDNALTLNLTFPLVASFRSGRPAPPPPPAPAAPGELSAVAVSPTEVALAWTDHAGNETGFQVEARLDEPGAGWQRVAELPADATQHVVGGLEADTAYRFRVRATRGGAASAFSNEAAATTPPDLPATPAGLAAEPLSDTAVRLTWDAAERATGYEMELRTADPAADRAAEPVARDGGGAVVDGLAAATPYTLRLRGVSEQGVSAWSAPVSVTTRGGSAPDAPCVADAETLCLLGGRFEVRSRWRNPRSPFGHGAAAAQSATGSQRTGFFTFFNPANVELVVKMLDGRPVNGAFWLFNGALSDVEYWLSVRDTEGGAGRTYHNEPFALCGRGDTTAFVDGPEGAAGSFAAPWLAADAAAPSEFALASAGEAAEGACTPGPEALCLAGGRFRVEVEWENPHAADSRGSGHVFAGAGSDRSGHFWFFRPDNLELAVKILDGRPINGHFWIFWGGLSDVGYTLRVTDTESGESHDFENPPLTLCGGAVTDRL